MGAKTDVRGLLGAVGRGVAVVSLCVPFALYAAHLYQHFGLEYRFLELPVESRILAVAFLVLPAVGYRLLRPRQSAAVSDGPVA